MDKLCQRVRETYGVVEYPVDVWRLAERLEVCIILRSWRGLPHAISVQAPRVVILNSRRSMRSRRFDLAHELAHFLLPVNGGYHTSAQNRFAAALLLPAPVFKLEWTIAGGQTGRVAEIFGVSPVVVELRRVELLTA